MYICMYITQDCHPRHVYSLWAECAHFTPGHSASPSSASSWNSFQSLDAKLQHVKFQKNFNRKNHGKTIGKWWLNGI